MVNPTIPEHLSLIYLVVSCYTSFIEPSIVTSLGAPRVQLRCWAKSLKMNAKIVPYTGLITLIFSVYNYFKLGNWYYLYGSLLLIITPIFMSILGKVP